MTDGPTDRGTADLATGLWAPVALERSGTSWPQQREELTRTSRYTCWGISAQTTRRWDTPGAAGRQGRQQSWLRRFTWTSLSLTSKGDCGLRKPRLRSTSQLPPESLPSSRTDPSPERRVSSGVSPQQWLWTCGPMRRAR